MFTENDPPPRGRRRPGRPRGPTARSAETRDLLYRTAVRMIGERGYEDTTLREIAAAAGVSASLLYRYFPSKRAVLLELYDALSLEFASRGASLPRAPWRARFLFALRASLDVLGPHRDALVALVPVLVGSREDGLFAPATSASRRRVQSVFVAAAEGASDRPRGATAEALGRCLYLVHLAVLLFWLLDRSAGQRATAALLALLERVLPALALALRLPFLRGIVRDLDRLSQDGLIGEPAT